MLRHPRRMVLEQDKLDLMKSLNQEMIVSQTQMTDQVEGALSRHGKSKVHSDLKLSCRGGQCPQLHLGRYTQLVVCYLP